MNKVEISCERCGQRLRLPSDLGDIVVTCPKCRHSWNESGLLLKKLAMKASAYQAEATSLIHDVEQGTPEWLALRRGIPTASQFCKIITSQGQASKQADTYIEVLIAELITGERYEAFAGNEWTERGKELEPEAVRSYERHMRVRTDKVGFVTDRDITVGCSPDRLVSIDGLLEVKCPAPHTHARYLRDHRIDMRYYPQVQGQMFVTGRKWVDFFSFHPDQPHLCVRITRDEPYLATFGELLRLFRRKLAERQLSISASSGAQPRSTSPNWSAADAAPSAAADGRA